MKGNMNYKDKKILRNDVLAIYNSEMPKLYIRYNKYTSQQVRLEVLSVLTEHILTKTKEDMSRKIRRKNSFKCLQLKVNELESSFKNKTQESFEKLFGGI